VVFKLLARCIKFSGLLTVSRRRAFSPDGRDVRRSIAGALLSTALAELALRDVAHELGLQALHTLLAARR
jgi:hypothetical protein